MSDGLASGQCNTLGLDPLREGHSKYWCFVDKDSPCVDKQRSSIKDGSFFSFQACSSKHLEMIYN